MKLKNKLLIKGILHSLLQLTAILLFGWFKDRLLEMIIFYICFFMFKPKFPKQYHALKSINCDYISIIVAFIISDIIPNKSISLLLSILVTYFVNYASYLYREHIDIIKIKKLKIYKGMKLKDLNDLCNLYNVEEIDRIILIEYYVNRKRLDNIAIKLNYSIECIKKRKANILKIIREPSN